MIRRLSRLACRIAVATIAATGAANEFSLRIEDELRRPAADPRTEARLASWSSPMGRLAYELQQQRSSVMRGGQPGGGNGLGLRLKIQSGLGLELVVSPVDTGVDLYQRTLESVHWPWNPAEEPDMSIEQRISILLGQRLARGGRERPAVH